LSSRKLLVLLERSREDSAFRTDAERGGRQTRALRIATESLNEQLRLRSVYEAVSSRGEVRWDPADYEWRDPVDQKEIDRKRAEDTAETEQASEDLYTDFGFT